MTMTTKMREAALRAALAGLNPDDLDFHASRYTSADLYQTAIGIATDPDDTRCVYRILCRAHSATAGDGGNRGTIPCLGGAPLAAWYQVKQILADQGGIR